MRVNTLVTTIAYIHILVTIINMTPIGKVDEYKYTNPKKDARENVFLNSFGSDFTQSTNEGSLS
ncbi:hypothetical protein [Gottschalkia acidurici]|uniref:hypothetical protein n=1 Tax=Clostridium acidurici TaxID=1556 RepID=UPI0016517EF5|nr:hypothetical protein [Gottschalkia acidurici]